MKSVLSPLCSCCGSSKSKQTGRLNNDCVNEDDELEIIASIGSKIQTSLPQLICKHVWTYDETQYALFNSSFFVVPTQVILKIFRLLSVGDLDNVSLVCRYFRMIVDQNKKWKIRCHISKKLNSESYKEISINWIYEKYLQNEELTGFEEQYRYIKIPCGLTCSSSPQNSLQSINNQSVLPMFRNDQHPNSSLNMIIQLSVDLDTTAHELISLLEKTSKYEDEWHKSVILQQMITRYHRFMILKSLYPTIYLVPTIDIEIVWQTHLLRPLTYRDDCLRLFNQIIDHSLLLNPIQQSFKQQSFFHTSYLYEKHFHEQYCSLPSYKNAKTSSSKYIHPYFNKLQSSTTIYSYWDKTLFQFSRHHPNNCQNPFSFTQNDIILDAEWINLCKCFINDIFYKVPNDMWAFNSSGSINLKSLEMKRLKKSYERFLYIIAKYPTTKQQNFIHPTYAIDIVWHSHMQEPLNYANDCISLVGYLINHYPSIDKHQRKQSAKYLNQYWIQQFQNDIFIDHLRNSSNN